MESTTFTSSVVIQMISNFVGGLCIFLLGMKYLSDGVQAVAGDRMRKMISMITDNRIAAMGTGLFVTSITQSSSVTTVMLVGLVNAGIMTLQQSIGVILGADIGSTVIAWIVAIKITKYGLIITGIAGLFYMFGKYERTRFVAMLIMGLGMLFFGLLLMEHGVEPFRNHQGFIALFSSFTPRSLWGVIRCVLIGALVTGIIQSSSATVAITITLARTAVIDFDTSVALVLGANIGTTITAFLASLGTSISAKRVAYAHILIKVAAVLITVPFFFPYLKLLELIMCDSATIATRIALAHSIFNVLLAMVFLPFTNLLNNFLLVLFKDKQAVEIPALTKLNKRLQETPVVAIEQSRREVIRMGEVVGSMLVQLREIITETGNSKKEKINILFSQEELLDRMQEEITVFLTQLLSGGLISTLAKEAQEQLRRSDEYESVSDYVVAILKLHLRLQNAKLSFDEEEMKDILELHTAVQDYYQLVFEAHKNRNTNILITARLRAEAITHLFRRMRSRHLSKLSTTKVDPLICTLFPDVLAGYRRVKDHLLNIAEADAEEAREMTSYVLVGSNANATT
ncbi:MAG: Na/Pi cotransporter family protein [Fibrobacter sp.]|jgi:phosphate:Na+ symporter|nr:Na/Pi cotransporter family protein [Fibrobacter sp.]